MKHLYFQQSNFDKQLKIVTQTSSLFDQGIDKRTRDILHSVESKGDSALIEYTEKFDKASLKPSQLRVPESEIDLAWKGIPSNIKKALRISHKNVKDFAKLSLRKNWSGRNSQGAKVGEKYDPFHRVGIYVPGGKAPLVSTVIMTVTLAKAAGCKEIVVTTPCDSEGHVNKYILGACKLAGATEVYRVGGAQAVAAMGYGTKRIPKVQKIYGPGNAYVVAAKRLLVGHVAIDLLPGPSELLVLADSSANPSWVAADLLAQAEHGSTDERVFLVSTSKKLLKDVERQIKIQTSGRDRSDYIIPTLEKNGFAIHVDSLDLGIRITNAIGPEHCEVMLKSTKEAIKQIATAGAIFVGGYSPTALGDYMAGPSHVLPTGGAGLSFPGLTVDQFQRRTSVVEFSRKALADSLPTLESLAALEGLDAHSRSGSIRLD